MNKSLNEQIAELKNIPGSVIPNGEFVTPSGIKYNWESWISDAFPLFIELPYSSKTTLLYAWANENAEHEMEEEEYCRQILEEFLAWKN
ncbi:hypothetical protein LCGC14_1413310 [marine sediment metagenome]|uniref:Uncharacterized protein n=1 Tax=marine sediment metagenome TaxID=412755 RepID=A0A0F9JTJ1_9ZZZZ|nr:hypothetical protein [Candidatus Aminicenantes bacterium]